MTRWQYTKLVLGRTGLIVAPFIAIIFATFGVYAWYVL